MAKKSSRFSLKHAVAGVALAFVILMPVAAGAVECWQGWGYFVEPKSLAFKSQQTLYVTDGPVNWDSREWIKLFPIDPKTGRRDRKREPVLVRPNRPSKQGGGQWGDVVEDVADVLGSKLSMLFRLSHVAPSQHSLTLNDKYSRWACGLE